MTFTIAANWKMYKGPSEAAEFFKDFQGKAEPLSEDRKVIFFVPAVDLWVAQMTLRNTAIGWGAQNCHFEMEGAFTGETSPLVLAQMATPYALVGHSERRTLFGETDEVTGRKIKSLHQVKITPMLCVGETLAEREGGDTASVIKRQLRAGLFQRDPMQEVLIAYEPVWAIGTGKVASAAQANEAHAVLRAELKAIGGNSFSEQTPILYGGSVKPENAVELAAQPEINGFLVGGASLKVDSFLALVQVAKE